MLYPAAGRRKYRTLLCRYACNRVAAYTERQNNILAEATGAGLKWNSGQISLTGDREDNQDRVSVSGDEHSFLAIVADGMGGHADGAQAAEVAIESCLKTFHDVPHPVPDPAGFLQHMVHESNNSVNNLGAHLPIELMPRTTIALALLQDAKVHWAHVGDSRVYLIRDGEVVDRTRDHSHVEILLQEGLITEGEIAHHPLRNFVESCLGGGSELPEMNVTRNQVLKPGDVVLLCTDGLWGGLEDGELARYVHADEIPITRKLRELCDLATAATFPNADNTTAAAVVWQETNATPPAE